MKQFENNTVSIQLIKKSASAESIKPVTQKNTSFKKVADEIKVYSEEDHLEKGSELSVELYEKFKRAILNLSTNLNIHPTKLRISFRNDQKILADIHILKNSLKLWVNLKKGNLDDPKKLTRDVSKIGHWGNGDYEIIIENDHHLEYIMSLVKQAL